MAHILDIPIRFRFLEIPAEWSIRTVKGKPHHEERQLLFPKVIGDPFKMKLTELDGWERRDAFFRLPEGDNERLLEFLTDVGMFSNLELSGHWSEEVTQHCREGHPVPIDPRGVWRFREGLRDALLNKKRFKDTYAASLSRNATALGMVQERGVDFPLRFELGDVASGAVTTTDAYHMLLATVYADVARGIRFKTCRREDCLKPFPITSKHAKRFCSQYCGHLVSQRKKRAAEQKQRRAEKRRCARMSLR